MVSMRPSLKTTARLFRDSLRHYHFRPSLPTITTTTTTTTTPSSPRRALTTTYQQTGKQQQQPTAIVLLSGGLDSATVLALAVSEGHTVTTLSFDYGQRHRHELQAASYQSTHLGATGHHVIGIDSTVFGGKHSLSTHPSSVPVPKHRNMHMDHQQQHNIPSTYVPARNTLFLAYALAMAEASGAEDIFIGANAVDYSGYPDCRPEYFKAFQHLVNVGTKAGVESDPGQQAPVVRVPLLHWSKKQIVHKGLQLGVDFAMTHSCYDPGADGKPCTACDSCILRADAFAQLGFPVDPAVERFQRSPPSTS